MNEMIVNQIKRISAVFLLLVSLSFADCGYFGMYLQNGVCVPDLLVNLSTIIMLIFISVAAIFYVVGIALEHARIIQWSKDFLYQLIGSALILSFYLGLLGILNFWAPALLNSNLAFPGQSSVRQFSPDSGWQTLHSHATTYVNCLITYTKKSIKNIVAISSSLSVIGSTSVNLQVGSSSQFFPVFPTGGGLTSLMPVVIGALATTLVQLTLQLKILELNSAFFSIILPLGLIFRSFPYTRGAGAAMIAITIGFTIFLPILYLIIEDVGYGYYPVNVCIASPPDVSFIQLVGIAIESVRNGALTTLQSYFASGGEFEGLIKIMVIQATLLPLFAYLITLNLTKRVSELLGGEIDFSTLVRLI